MSHHNGQTSSIADTNSENNPLPILRQEENRLINDIKAFEKTNFQKAVELILLLNTELPLKNHYFGIEQQPVLCMPEKASEIALTAVFRLS